MLFRSEAWTPKKLYALLDKADLAGASLNVGEAGTRIGDCPRDYAQSALRLLTSDEKSKARNTNDGRYFQLLATRLTMGLGCSCPGIGIARRRPG